MKKSILFVLILIPLHVHSQNKDKLREFVNRSQIAQMGCYQVVKPKPASEFMDLKLKALTKIGFDSKSSKYDADGNIECLKQDEKCFAYYKDGIFRYCNQKVLPLNDQDLADTNKLIKVATELQSLLVSAGKHYKLISKNKIFYMHDPDITEKLAYISYRFVRVLDNRLVLGNTDQMIITLGADGKLKECRSSEPEYEPVITNSRATVKPVAYEKVLRMKQQEKGFESFKDEDGKLIEYEQLDIDDATDAYYECMNAGKKVIVPHVAFLLSYNDNDTKITGSILVITC